MVALDDLTEKYLALGVKQVDDAGALAGNIFRGLGSWRDPDIDRFVEQLSVPLSGIKTVSAQSAMAYHQKFAGINDKAFKMPDLASLDLSTQALRNGATANTVYSRPFVQMRMALAKGQSVTESIDVGANTATSLARTEIQLTRRRASLFARSANDNIVGYLRTLTGLENCALCYVASTQRYRRGDLLPIHPGCDCGEMPIYGDSDPGQVIDDQLLEKSHQAVQDRFGFSSVTGRDGIDYRKVVIRDHGELGPMLTVKGHKFTGPNSLDLVGKKMPVTSPAKKAVDAVETAKAQVAQIPAGDVVASTAIDAYRTGANVATVKVSRLRGKKNTDFVEEKIPLPDAKTNEHLDKILAVGKTADEEITRRTSAVLAEKNVGDVNDARKRYEAKRALHQNALAAESAYTKKLEADFEARIARDYGDLQETNRTQYFETVRPLTNKFYDDLQTDPYRLSLVKKADQLRREALEILDEYNTAKNIIVNTRVEETKKFISEIRSVGEGVQPTFMAGGQAVPHIKYAFEQYPSDWVTKASSEIPRVQPRKVERGWHVVRTDMNGKYSEIRISGPTQNKPSPTTLSTRTAIHEVGHYMETTIPGLREMEWAYYHRRANGEYVENDLGFGNSESNIVDAWRRSYSGKSYSGLLADPVSRNYEIFTTGIESVLGSSNYFDEAIQVLPSGKELKLAEDTEFRQFILGVLLGL